MRPRLGVLFRWLAISTGVAACGANGADMGPKAAGGAPPSMPPDAAPPDARDEGPAFPDLPLDPGFVGTRKLSNTEYDYTVRDLLGVTTSAPGYTLPAPDVVFGFDNAAIDWMVPEEAPREYPAAAQVLATQVFASPELRARIVTCAPDASPDGRAACATDIVRAFGRRAWRRPLSQAEVDALVAVATADPTEDFAAAIQRVVVQVLSSPRFVYRIEVDPDPASKVPHPVTPYELASRLSYLLWSTMPDQALFDLAESGDLAKPEVLLATLRRMLGDDRSSRFMHDFAGQWLEVNEILEHQADPLVFPLWSAKLVQSMSDEAYRYLQDFLHDRPLTELLTEDVNFVDGPLAAVYGIAAPTSTDGLVRVETTGDKRRGFLGLAGVLSATSHAQRTSSMLRGRFVLDRVLCIYLAPPSPSVPILTDEPSPGATYREQVEWISTHKECAYCHIPMDGIGLGMDDFDGIGGYRTLDEKGRVLDVRGTTPDGTQFNGGGELGPALAKDPRTLECAVRNMLVYTTGRVFSDPGDDAIIARLTSDWKADPRLEKLFEPVVMSPLFRTRRGRGAP